MKWTPARTDSAATRLVLTAIPVLWGLALIGVAFWLSRHESSGGTVACLIFSAGYFWFGWSLYHSLNDSEERTARGSDGSPPPYPPSRSAIRGSNRISVAPFS